ncbi:MAG TPA: DUF302 domain-containing protein, partial [Cyclobacteriaceae bacterium]|nr:DUF302 domain-containing protein [Cyclobacteriaceae bacterium]
ACNPQFAYKAISLESQIGLMLPCNIVVQEHENKEIEVSAINPLETIDRENTSTEITEIAHEVSNRLRVALDELGRDSSDAHPSESFPTGSQQWNPNFQCCG